MDDSDVRVMLALLDERYKSIERRLIRLEIFLGSTVLAVVAAAGKRILGLIGLDG